MDRQIVLLARRLSRLEKQIKQRKLPTLGYSSIDDGAMTSVDDDGIIRMIIGKQSDGTQAVTVLNGPTPPAPSAPIVTSLPGILRIRWDGLYSDPEVVAPLDFERVMVYAVPADEFLGADPVDDIEYVVGEINSDLGGEVTAALEEGVEHLVYLSVWSQADEASPESEIVHATPASSVQLPTWESDDTHQLSTGEVYDGFVTYELKHMGIVGAFEFHAKINGVALAPSAYDLDAEAGVVTVWLGGWETEDDVLGFDYAWTVDRPPPSGPTYGPWVSADSYLSDAAVPGYQYRRRIAWNNPNDTDYVSGPETDAAMNAAFNALRTELDGATSSDLDPARDWNTQTPAAVPSSAIAPLVAWIQFLAEFHGDGTFDVKGPHVEEYGTFISGDSVEAAAWAAYEAYVYANMPPDATGVEYKWSDAVVYGRYKSIEQVEVTVDMSAAAGGGDDQPDGHASGTIELFSVPTTNWYDTFDGHTKTSRLVHDFADVTVTGSSDDASTSFVIPGSELASNGGFCLVPEITQGSTGDWSGWHWDIAAGYFQYISTEVDTQVSVVYTLTPIDHRYVWA